ncbi:MAG: D-tyrosyl-tRNA(Tyr) deacylase [Nitrospiraceae bacterium]|nr:D-tyrosyl-tRNA(Tyr) deacylase [Nitrospiraceae bacterium]
MRAIIQRVNECAVYIENKRHSRINVGILVFACFCKDDTQQDLDYIAKKIVNMRIFSDSYGRFNLSLKDINGESMIISQFTLAADTRKGNRPSYFYAMEPKKANAMYEQFLNMVKNYGIKTSAGIFGSDMKIKLINDGPVTIYLDSKNR